MSTSKHTKKVVRDEDETEGVKIARGWRKVASALSDAQRMELKKRAMARIYGERPHAIHHGRP